MIEIASSRVKNRFPLVTYLYHKKEEERYLKGAELGMKPQELKRIYPLGAKTV